MLHIMWLLVWFVSTIQTLLFYIIVIHVMNSIERWRMKGVAEYDVGGGSYYVKRGLKHKLYIIYKSNINI